MSILSGLFAISSPTRDIAAVTRCTVVILLVLLGLQSCGNPHVTPRDIGTDTLESNENPGNEDGEPRPVVVDPDVPVEQPKNVQVEIMDTDLNFGGHLLNDPAVRRDVIIRNSGEAAVMLLEMKNPKLKIEGIADPIFEVTDSKKCLGKVLEAGSTCILQATFSPLAVKEFSHLVTFMLQETSASNKEGKLFGLKLNLIGSVVDNNPNNFINVSIRVENIENKGNILDNGDNVNFGTINHILVTNRTFVITNESQESITKMTPIIIDIENKNNFIVDFDKSDCDDGPLDPKKSCRLVITFKQDNIVIDTSEIKEALDQLNLNLELLSKVWSTPGKDRKFVRIFNIYLNGQIVPDLQPNDLSFDWLSQKEIDFGKVQIGNQVVRDIVIRKNTLNTLDVKNAAITGKGAGSISFLGGKFPGDGGTCGYNLNSTLCKIVVVFSPKSVGSHAVDLNIAVQGDTNKRKGGTLYKKLYGIGITRPSGASCKITYNKYVTTVSADKHGELYDVGQFELPFNSHWPEVVLREKTRGKGWARSSVDGQIRIPNYKTGPKSGGIISKAKEDITVRPTLPTFYGLGGFTNVLNAKKKNFNLDNQVVVAFNMNESLGWELQKKLLANPEMVKNVDLKISVVKGQFHEELREKTDLICITSHKLSEKPLRECSGYHFNLGHWLVLANSSFWAHGNSSPSFQLFDETFVPDLMPFLDSRLSSHLFVDKILETTPTKSVMGKNPVYELETEFSLKELFENITMKGSYNSIQEGLMSMQRDFGIVLADDVAYAQTKAPTILVDAEEPIACSVR